MLLSTTPDANSDRHSSPPNLISQVIIAVIIVASSLELFAYWNDAEFGYLVLLFLGRICMTGARRSRHGWPIRRDNGQRIVSELDSIKVPLSNMYD